jgi:hypothetical protein
MKIGGKWLVSTDNGWGDQYYEQIEVDYDEESEDSVELIERIQNYITLSDEGADEFYIDGVYGSMDSYSDEETMLLEFTWDGEAENSNELMHGRGWIDFSSDEPAGELFVHGDSFIELNLKKA